MAEPPDKPKNTDSPSNREHFSKINRQLNLN